MTGTVLKWLIPCLVTVVGGTAIAIAGTGSSLSSGLSGEARAALGPDAGWANVTLDGREAVVSGTATDATAADAAIARVAAVDGIAAVVPEIQVIATAHPFPFSVTAADGFLALSGGVPSISVGKVLVADAGEGTRDDLKLLGGAPAAFPGAAEFAVEAAKHLDDGSVELSDLSLSITGRAKSLDDYSWIQSLPEVPEGVSVAQVSVEPPVASPFVFSVSYDGTAVAISGDTPDSSFEQSLRDAVSASIPMTFDLTPASGGESDFKANALVLLKSLLTLQSGEAHLSDGKASLSGKPATAEIAKAATAEIASLGGTATLDAPQGADYTLAVTKDDGKLTFAGAVPDKATRDKLAALDGAAVDSVTAQHGAPEHFTTALDFGLEALSHLVSGEIDIKGAHLNLGGVAPSVADYNAVSDLVAKGTEGFTVTAGDLQPPAADPFMWSATKAADGSIAMTGFVPDDTARSALRAKMANPGGDDAEPAQGAPDNFVLLAGKGLDVLALLDTGTVAFDGTSWSIEGSVDSAKKGFAADAAYSVAGLRTAGWTYTLHAPTLPSVTPYVWRAQKSADGSISISGYSPDAAFQQTAKGIAMSASDTTSLAAGAPPDFAKNAAAALDALSALEEGSAALDGSQWSLAGTVAASADRDALLARLSAATDTSHWQINVEASDTAPVVTPYLWSATKTADGAVTVAGYLPSGKLKGDIAAKLGASAHDTTAFASGQPAEFENDVLAGIDALGHLSAGRAAFDGTHWTLTGNTASQADSDAATAAVAHGSNWNTVLSSAGAASAVVAEASSQPASAEISSALEASSAPPSSASSAMASASSETVTSSAQATSSASAAAASEASASETSSSAPAQVASSSEAPASSASASSAELSSSMAPSAASAPPAPAAPMPTTLVFEATYDGAQTMLKGGAPSAAAVGVLTKAAGVSPKALKVTTGLPDTFVASANSGLGALTQLDSGHLGFDGTTWWLRGSAATQALHDAVAGAIAALPNGSDWSVAIDVASSPLVGCRERVAGLAKRNAIQFVTGKATLTKDSSTTLDELAADLKICPDTNVHVQGHTDSDGTAAVNVAVSVARAEAVVAALAQRGIDDSRLYAEGFGSTVPVASNDTKAGKAANRRIAFEIDPQ